jgi:tryptophan synthase alpha chain
MVCRLEEAGADVIELGVPFSDPLADGKVNQQASARALAAGATVAGVLDAVAEIRQRSQVPVVLFTYLNPLYAYGYERLCRDAAKAGVDGILALDLPVEEGEELRRALAGHGLDNISLVAPTSTKDRVRATVSKGSGFVYCVSHAGVTGMQEKVDPSASLIRRVRAATDLPTALGFGVSTPAQARAAVAEADAVVVGSAIVKRFHEAPHTRPGRKAAAAWVATLVQAVKEA